MTDLVDELYEENDKLATIDTSNNFTKLGMALQTLDTYLELLPKQTEGADDRIEWTIQLLEVVEEYRYYIYTLWFHIIAIYNYIIFVWLWYFFGFRLCLNFWLNKDF